MTEREIVRDPVHRARYRFTPDGENLWVETWIEPGGVIPAHYHRTQEERWEVLDGEIEFRLGWKKRILRPADGPQSAPPRVVHGLKNVSGRETHLRCHVLPAGNLESFLTESAAAAREGLFMRGGIPRSRRGLRWMADFAARSGDEVVLLWPPPPLQRLVVALLGHRRRR